MKQTSLISQKVLVHLLLALDLMLTLTGCLHSEETAPVNPTTTSTPLPAITITRSPSPSQTTIPPTRTPVTPVPTLLLEEKEDYLLRLIESNGGCKLPCFLGIQPGISAWEEIRKLEAPLFFRENYAPDNKGSIFLHSHLEKRIENFDVIFWGQRDVVEHITVDARIYLPNDPYEYSPKFERVMSSYSLPKVLSEYGVPTRVLLQVQGQVEPGAGTQAEILLFYNFLGIVAHYMFVDVVVQDSNTGILRTCLDYEHVYFIRLYLQSPKDNTPLERMIAEENDPYLSSWLRPVEKITTLSLKDFYSLFVESNENACFDVP